MHKIRFLLLVTPTGTWIRSITLEWPVYHGSSKYKLIQEQELVSGKNVNTNDCVIFEVFMVVTMKNAVFYDVTLHDSCKNRCFGGTQHLHHQGDKNL
jgi:hypothetical protein